MNNDGDVYVELTISSPKLLLVMVFYHSNRILTDMMFSFLISFAFSFLLVTELRYHPIPRQGGLEDT